GQRSIGRSTSATSLPVRASITRQPSTKGASPWKTSHHTTNTSVARTPIPNGIVVRSENGLMDIAGPPAPGSTRPVPPSSAARAVTLTCGNPTGRTDVPLLSGALPGAGSERTHDAHVAPSTHRPRDLRRRHPHGGHGVGFHLLLLSTPPTRCARGIEPGRGSAVCRRPPRLQRHRVRWRGSGTGARAPATGG